MTITPTPTATPRSLIRLAVIGDFGMDNTPEAEVASLVARWAPDVVVTTGDNNYPDGAAETIDANVGQFYHQFIYPYHGSYGTGATVNRFFPVLGNHDWYAATGTPPLPWPHLDYFSLPSVPGQERYYAVELGPVHLFALDSDANEPDGITSTSVQADWLRGALVAAAAPWKLVIVHHPPYSSSSVHGSTPTLQWPFGAWGATAVLAGHAHSYERLDRDSLLYFVNGSGGAPLYPMGSPLPGSQARFAADHGAMLIAATPLSITFQFVDREGVLRDRVELMPSPPPPLPAWQTLELRVAQREDDAEEYVRDQRTILDSTDLELTEDLHAETEQTVGLRFAPITLPVTATVTRAYVEFVVDEAGSAATTLEFAGELTADPAPFAALPGNLSERPHTQATVTWPGVPPWPAVGARQRSPDLAAVVQEQLSQPGFAPGNALVILITGRGRRTAVAYDGQPAAAPLLHIEYVMH